MANERELQRAQAAFFNSPSFVALLSKAKGLYAPHFATYQDHLTEADLHHADTHPKKELRKHAWEELQEELPPRLWLKSVLYKLKRLEIAKPGKYPRMIGDLGVAASLQGFRLTHFLKQAQDSERLDFNGGYARFVKAPTPEVLKEVFDDLISPPGRFVFIYFSDDACYSYRDDNGQVHMYNLDISSCDASHGPAVFEALEKLVPDGSPAEDLKVLTDQCRLPIRVVDANDHRRVVILRPRTARLYSGSTITTAINNLANLSIAFSITLDTTVDITQAARQAGYSVTVQQCQCPEDLQFLKHSPILDDQGRYQPLLNLGVLLRLSGVAKGDLPGKGDLFTRARAFQKALLNGVSNGSSYTVLDKMRMKCLDAEESVVYNSAVAELTSKVASAEATFDDSSIYRRYRLDDTEVLDLLSFADADTGTVHAGPAFSKVLEKDYGLRADLSVL